MSAIVVDAAFHIHRELGPGLLESVYETVLAHELRGSGLSVARQLVVPIEFRGIKLDEGLRLDLLVEGKLVVELKSVEVMLPIHTKQLLTYLRLLHLPLGLLLNFGTAMFRDGVKRVVNDHRNSEDSRLRINQT